MTAQIGEEIIIEGKKEPMAFCPPLPKDKIRANKDDENKETDCSRFRETDLCSSTACWRGYNGTWEIKDGARDLANIEFYTS